MKELGDVSLGLAGALGPDRIGRLAVEIERAGFFGLWVNDTPGGDALTALAAAARVTSRIRLGAGVIALDRRPAEQIAAALGDLPQERLVLGLGVGRGSRGSLDGMRDAVALLRERTEASVVVGALGPRMRGLAARVGDGVLLNWLPAAAADEQRAELQRVAADAGRPAPRTILYVRTIVDDAARPALEREAARYGGVPAYAANFERLGVEPIDTTLTPPLEEGIRTYRGAVDELVLRAITADDAEPSYARFIETAAAALA
ncbi:alkanesulfonate monooxygenase SsuD/methylene tetrahydromethanopterin reductase-like flavin-dependent oxidoreductase (luciferase family) [Diaminobutyricimonas aerilata]|uniref:Alkanesulfonate monooxygenase SsuD/methylene tetrahydromethanopterin reductase-like flavin-dependent oxidoreductase (Luciferase family) n=1 Tax=Diaminobutyricimonas aerilata TaxID=1162967 RepID=A0A2M9CFE2_9MICO|nr:LLM class flavin-dependent oxidoreductase [Diaminobutyricimonas aerilata]PJJ70572.1 alkanesulfonate monooxygenase SsuD/methylene tetrahydromethanopterin reductase-like flavin-dependent oxidoreductase (luciferase family) [Diaminobutyricimonas aerilata]